MPEGCDSVHVPNKLISKPASLFDQDFINFNLNSCTSAGHPNRFRILFTFQLSVLQSSERPRCASLYWCASERVGRHAEMQSKRFFGVCPSAFGLGFGDARMAAFGKPHCSERILLGQLQWPDFDVRAWAMPDGSQSGVTTSRPQLKVQLTNGLRSLPPRFCGLPVLCAFAVEIVHWTIFFQPPTPPRVFLAR